jgi:hypothetical protein
VNLINAANFRRIIPGIVVAGVLAFSALAQVPTLASNGGSGYNCGVKGNGYHDHGKVCPNRPFPGRGEGITEAVEGTQSEDNSTTSKVSGQVSPGSIKRKTTVSATVTVAPTVTESDTSTSDANAHDSGHAHGSGHGHSNGHGHGD